MWVTPCVEPLPSHPQIFHMILSRQVVLWNRSRWVSWLWRLLCPSVVGTCLPLLHDDWPIHVGSADLGRPLQPGTHSEWVLGTDEFKWWERALAASLLIANILTGHKLWMAGELCQDSSRLLPCSCLCPLSTSFTLWFREHHKRCFWAETATSLKALHRYRPDFPLTLLSHCQPANNAWLKCHCQCQNCQWHCAGALLELIAKDCKQWVIWDCVPAHA